MDRNYEYKSSVDNGGSAADDSADSLYEKKWNAAFARLKAFKAKFGKAVFFLSLQVSNTSLSSNG